MSETNLTKHLPNSWQVRQVVIFDWFDGPHMGLCALSFPNVSFQFQIMAQGCYDQIEASSNLYTVKIIPNGTVQRVVTLIQELGSPKQPVWIPIWKFKTKSAQLKAELEIDLLLTEADETPLIIETNDMLHFTGCWTKSN